jgi:hypothetical protein
MKKISSELYVCLLLQVSAVVGVSAVLGVLLLASFLLICQCCWLLPTPLLVLLWVFLLYSTERLQQQGLRKVTGKEKWR